MILRLFRRLRGLSGSGRVETQRFQRLFLLGCHLTVLVLAVEHMTLMDVGCAFVQMQCPVQHMNVFANLALNSSMNSVTMFSKSSAEACSSSVPSW